MVPPGPPAPFEGSQAVPTANFLWSNSGLLGSSGNGMPSQGAFPSLVSPRNQLGNMNMLGNMPNVSSLLQQSLANAGHSPGISGPGSVQQQRVLMDNGAESDPLGNGMGCNVPSASFVSSSQNPKTNATATFQGGQQFSSPNMNQMLADLQTNSQMDPNYFQHCQQSMNQFNATSNPQNQLQQQQQGQSIRAGLGAVGMVKPEPQMTNGQTPAMQNSSAVKLEPQQFPSMRSLPSVKMEPQTSDSPLFSPRQQQQQLQQQQQQQLQQQQQQQFLNASRQSPQAVAAAQILHQQRLTQLQQQQLAKGIPQQRVPVQQQFQAQNMPIRSPVTAKPIYEPGMCARRLTHYMYQQQHRPEDNNIEYWKKFVAEYFAPNAKKKWCVSMYGNSRQITGVFPQDIWHCEICNRKPGRGFEATVEVLPRLFKLKYESGTLDELLYVDMPREYQNSSGQIVLDYAKAIQESVFEQLRVVRDGQLRIVFSQDLKICSWEFCARRHEELIPKRLLIPQVHQLGAAAQKYQAAAQSAPANLSVPDLQNNCNMFIASARQLAKTLEVPLVNDLGYSKRYVRCLQISEVVNSMKDLIDFSRESGTGPMESLAKFPRRTGSFSGMNNGQPQQSEDQQQQQQQSTPGQNANGDDCVQAASSLQVSCSNGMLNVNNPGTSSGNRLLLHQNSMNSRPQNQMNNGGGGTSPYMGTTNSQLQSPSSSGTTLPQTQTIPSPIQSPMPPSSSNNPPQQQLAVPSSSDAAANDSQNQSSVQKIIQDMMMTSQHGGGGMMGMNNMGNDLKNANGLLQPTNGFGGGGSGFGNNGRGGGGGQDAAMVNGIRAALRNNNNNSSMTTTTTINGRIGMTYPREQSLNQQHDMGNNLPINGLGSVNGFNSLQFDWKTSP